MVIWQGMFFGDERLKYYGFFCAGILVATAVFIGLCAMVLDLYFFLCLRKRFPAEWAGLCQSRAELGTYGHYRKWVIAHHQEASPFYKLMTKQMRFNEGCVLIWLVVITGVGLMALTNWLVTS